MNMSDTGLGIGVSWIPTAQTTTTANHDTTIQLRPLTFQVHAMPYLITYPITTTT